MRDSNQGGRDLTPPSITASPGTKSWGQTVKTAFASRSHHCQWRHVCWRPRPAATLLTRATHGARYAHRTYKWAYPPSLCNHGLLLNNDHCKGKMG